MLHIMGGLFLITISVLLFWIMYIGEPSTFLELNFIRSAFFTLAIMGIYFIFVGLKGIIKNKILEEKGIIYYGRICKLNILGNHPNDIFEYKADVAVFNEAKKEIELISETIDLEDFDYTQDTYVTVLYYKNIIKFEKIINKADIPENIERKLSQYKLK